MGTIKGVILSKRVLTDISELLRIEREEWDERNRKLWIAGEPMNAGETQNYHETRLPTTQTSDFTQITLSTSSKSIMSVTADLPGSQLQFAQQGYWQIGKKWHVRMFGKATTGATPGNLTIEIRHQTGTAVTDAGGTILATSGAVAMGASKTNASWFLDFTIESRAQPGTAAGLFAKGFFLTDPTTALIASTVNPIFIPTTGAAATNVDTTLAGYINVQWKRSGSTAETVTVQDVQVNAIT